MESVRDKNNHPWENKIIIRGEGYYRPPLSPPKAGRTSLSASWESLCVVCPHFKSLVEGSANCIFIQLRREYPMHKKGNGYGFYCMLKQAEIDVQLTSNRKLPNFYEKVTDLSYESAYKKCLREEWGKFTGYQLLSSFWLKVARTDEDGNTTRWDRGTLPIRNLYPKWWMLRFGRIRKVTNWIWILWFIVSYWWAT